MYDIIVNGQVVGVVTAGVVKLFARSLVSELGYEFSLQVRPHVEPEVPAEAPKAKASK